MRIRAPLAVIEVMAVAMQTEDFPYLPSGPAEGMTCFFTDLTYISKEQGAGALGRG